MVGVRSMLARVRRLEATRAMVSPIQRWYGSVEAFEVEVRAGVDAGARTTRHGRRARLRKEMGT